MVNSKKISLFLFSLLLALASFLFVACGTKDYSNVTLSASQEEVVMYANEENPHNVTFTINNPVSGMASSLSSELSNPGICSVDVVSTQNYSTTYALTGIKGGNTDLIVKTKEGSISHTISITVRQYTTGLTPADNSLYLSLSSPMQPTSADFIFSDNATERELEYYFYGTIKDSSNFELSDITQGSSYVNGFSYAQLITLNDNYYVIFTSTDGSLYTLGQPTTDYRTGNVLYDFITVEYTDGNYEINPSATPVSAGKKLSFIAINRVESDQVIYAIRDFYIILDINYDSISHDYGYRILKKDYTAGSDILYRVEGASETEIVLLPSYQSAIEDGPFIGYTVDYITAYLAFTINSDNDLLKLQTSVDNQNVINVKRLDSITSNGQTTYYFEINCATGSASSTMFNINFYYKGFENSEDSNVNYTYSIPVNIRRIPTSLLVNNIDLSSTDVTYTFYNSYVGDSGWQQFVFTPNPEDSEYTNLTIDLTNSNLQLRYNNRNYTNQVVTISDLNQVIYIKGINDAPISTDVQSLPISLNYSVLTEDSIELELKYVIVQGATVLDYKTEQFSSMVYVDYNLSEPIEFLDLYANAQFSNIEVSLLSGTDVVRFITDSQNPYIKEGNNYILNLSLMPIAVNTGTYTISLDNGKQTTITITVEETLQELSVTTQNQQNSIRYSEEISENDRDSTLYYVYNADNQETYFDVEVVANGQSNSSAITNIQFTMSSDLIQIGNAENNNRNFNVYIRANGSSQLELIVSGYSIQDFQIEEITKRYYIDVVGFSYIGGLNVFKARDGRGDYIDSSSENEDVRNYGINAAYADVYSGTNLEEAREAVFNITVDNPNAYLFANPANLDAETRYMYVENTFSPNYVYWEVDSSLGLQKDGEYVDFMYYSITGNNVYTIVGFGTFDTSTMTFTAFSNFENPQNFRLIAHVRQYGRVYSYTINIRISVYEEVSRITLQEDITMIEFTSTQREASVVAYPTNLTATNGELVALPEGGAITIEDQTFYMLDENSIEYIESDGRYQIILTVNDDFVEQAETYEGQMTGLLRIVARDWLDENDNLRPEYEDLAVDITVRFANGTEQNRFTLDSAEDLVNMNLSAHYQINTTIDVSSISDRFPLGELRGSIVGANQFAQITGINILNYSNISDSTSNYYGIFTSIAQDAYIEYITFSGQINIGQSSQEASFAPENSYIGLLAGVNNGTLINVGVNLNGSQINIVSGFVGGLVGYNNGSITQDYTLFEDLESNTRTYTQDQLTNENNVYDIVGSGRYSYANLSPNILMYMTNTMTVNYISNRRTSGVYNTYIGGVAGYNNGQITKIDSKVLDLIGYTNYMAYSLINTVPVTFSTTQSVTSQTYVGGLVGVSSNNSSIISGYNIYQNDTLTFSRYTYYEGSSSPYQGSAYISGEGIVVGGQISGYDYVGGVIGYINSVGDNGISLNEFTGITSRTFIRGYLSSETGTTSANVAGIANIENAETLTTAFAMQAIDEGALGINATMILLYSTTAESGYFNDLENNIANSNKLAFGISSGNRIATMYGVEGEQQSDYTYTNVNTYAISREKIRLENSNSLSISNLSRTSYYGDFAIVGDSGNTLLAQSFFISGGDDVLSIEENFNNKLEAESYPNYQGVGRKNIFYMFYFESSNTNIDANAEQDYQTLLDTYMNVVNYGSILYPINSHGELRFTSNTTNVLSIDQNGRIEVRSTGLAHISATSILNSNNAIDFYIYVVNYFNPGQPSFTSEENDNSSIIYPSGSSTPLDDSTINLRGQNNVALNVRPQYSLVYNLSSTQLANQAFVSDVNGEVTLNNVVFNLSPNTEVSAYIEQVTRADQTTGEPIDASNELNIEITGQTINITKNDYTVEGDYRLIITPRLYISIQEVDTLSGEQVDIIYASNVNKRLDNVTLNYREGAISVDHIRYNEVTILSSKHFEDTIVINSTAQEETPYYYIVGPNNENIQGSERLKELLNFNFKYDSSTTIEYGDDFLFNVSLVRDNNYTQLSNQRFNLSVSVNKYSSAYLNRYLEDIYGEYTIYILAQSNTSFYTSITINFEQTNVTSVLIDNYTNILEATGATGISVTSDYAYPGTTGLLTISITPEDSDFDYILIENVEENYQSGNSYATFGLLTRKLNSQGEDNLFDNQQIFGSIISTGLRLNLNDIIDAYNQTENVDGNLQNKYYQYNGVIYISYDMGAMNVIDGSQSTFKVTLMKDGAPVYTAYKDLTIRLQNYVSVDLEGKTPVSQNEGNYYATYNVARGMRYQLNINSYGYQSTNISAPTVTNSSLARIVEENGVYYLEITSDSINYLSGNSSFDINITATQIDGEIERTSSSQTHINIQEYVVNYNGETAPMQTDIVRGMGDGEINIQVGTQTTLEVDLYEYIEYDETNIEVANSVDTFIDSLSTNGIWKANTNLIGDNQPDYGQADEDGTIYYIGYYHGVAESDSNYYFNYDGLDIIPVRTHTPEDRFYYISYFAQIEYNATSGIYTVSELNKGDENTISIGQNIIHTQILFNVYSSSSEESPIPIYDYNDFLEMQRGGYYILLNDITLPNVSDEANEIEAYSPMQANFKSLDGNGHTINFAGTYDMGSSNSIGLFTSLPSGSIIRNLNVNFTASNSGSDVSMDANDDYGWNGLYTVKFITTASSFNFGAIVVNNQGIITNCNVTTDTVGGNEYYVVVQANNALNSTSYLGGITASNSGYITNSSVSINMKTPYYMAGVAGQNSGKIASTYFKEGKLINNSQQDQHVAGFVVNNTTSGQIITSYVAGGQTNTSIYSKDTDSYIQSTIAGAGFVYQNSGYISDCYTDITLSRTYSDMAGFAYYNGGTIKNSFSLSELRNNVTASAGFARFNTLDNLTGTFIDCYYFYNQKNGQAEDGFLVKGDDINTSVIPINYDGITRLNAGDFANTSEYFSNYSYQSSIGVNAVWFYSTGNTSSTFVDYVPTAEKIEVAGEEGQLQTNTVYATQLKTFGLNRLELVSPNVDSLSIRNFSYSEVDATTGEAIYHYIDASQAPNRGSIHNPRIIYDANTMESEILERNSNTNLNTDNYRLVSDIDYSNYGLSELYQTIYAGVFEGNGMEVSQISLASTENLTNAGMFAQIGYSSSSRGSVKNLKIIPNQIAFTNTNSVGTLAGTLRYGYIYDITIEGKTSSSSDGEGSKVVIGQNFVGGVVGRAITSYTMKNIVSNISSFATYTSSDGYAYNEAINTLTNYSYSGGIAGYLGTGNANNLEINEISVVSGGRAGFAFGGIGNNANVSYVFVDVLRGGTIRAYNYGGYVSGEVSGSLSYAYVSNNQSEEATFAVMPLTPSAVGGITGILSGGTISNAVMEQSFSVVGVNSSSMTINNVGGIAGIVTSAGNYPSTIEYSVVNANISTIRTLGGAVGRVENTLRLDNIAVKSSQLSITGQSASPVLGGIVGNLTNENNSSLTMTNSYCTSSLLINSYTSGIDSRASAGGLIGSASVEPYLAYCYTTSTIQAEIVDMRSTGQTMDYSNKDTDTIASAMFNYLITNSGDSSTMDGNYNNVYFLGHNTETVTSPEGDNSVLSYQESRNYGIAFTTKVLNASIGLTINNYGTSSSEYATNFSTEDNTVSGTNSSIFNNLFGSVFNIVEVSSSQTGTGEGLSEVGTVTTESKYYTFNNINDSYIFGEDIFTYDEASGEYRNTTTLENITIDIDYHNNINDYNGAIDITYISSTGIRYIYDQRNNRWGFVQEGQTAGSVLDEITNIASIEKCLVAAEISNQSGVYTDGNGNFYQFVFYYNEVNSDEGDSQIDPDDVNVAYRNIITNIVYTLSDTISLYQVWDISADSISTLAFENDLSWTNR